MGRVYKLPLVLTPQSEGGYVVTCPLLPELVTEGDTLQEALINTNDALESILVLQRDFAQVCHSERPKGAKNPVLTLPQTLWNEILRRTAPQNDEISL